MSVKGANEITVTEKDETVSFEDLTSFLHDVHQSTVSNGMHFAAASQNAQETQKRLGSRGTFFVARTKEKELVGCGAVSYGTVCPNWFARNKPYCEIKMVGVKPAFRGQGINNRIYEALENYGFTMANILTMNTAVDNKIVIQSNLRHGWVIVGYTSWKTTDYYSVIMAKWKRECPYNQFTLFIVSKLSWIKVHFLKDRFGNTRLKKEKRL